MKEVKWYSEKIGKKFEEFDMFDKYITDVLKEFVKEQKEKINYTPCCETLPTKKIMNFDDWLKFLKWEQVGNSYVYKHGNKYKDANELKQAHSKYLRI